MTGATPAPARETAGRATSPPREQTAWPILLGIVLAALALRFLPYRWVFQPDGVRFYDSDSYYHMRRVWMCLAHFPRVPIRDPFENHPFGGVTMWPPLHDTLIAAVILALGGAQPSEALVDRVGAVMPAVLGALAVLPVYSIGRRLMSRRSGLLAAGLMAIQPAHILYSAVGRPDQHVTEILLSAMLYSSLLGFRSFREDSGASSGFRRWWPRIAAGVTATAAVLVWMGSLLFVCVAAGFGGLALLSRVRRSSRPIEPLAEDFCAFLAVHAVTLAAGTAYLLAGMEVENTYVSFSWFQAHFSLLVALGFVLGAAVLTALRAGAKAAFRSLGPALAVLALTGALLIPTQLGGTLSITANALRHVNKTSQEVASSDTSHHLLSYNAAWLRSIQEYTPLLYPDGRLDPRWALDYVGPILFLAPAMIGWFLVRRRGVAREQRWLVPVWAAAVAAMSLSQVKYVYLVSSLAALLLADLLGEVRVGVTRLLRASADASSLATATVALAMLAPGLRYLSRFNAGYVDLPEHQRAALLTLEQISPDPGSFVADDAAPAYGVMTFWDLGNYTLYLARRPVVANNNGYGFDDSIAFFLAPTEADAVAILDRRKVRYAVLSDVTADLASVHEIMTGSLAPYFSADAARRLELLEPFEGLVYSRLFFADAGTVDAAKAPPLEHFRLLFEAPGPASAAFGRIVAPTKIFERVAGAEVLVSGLSTGVRATLRTVLTSNLGRTWTDERTATADERGEARIRTPYGVSAASPVRATSSTLAIDGREPVSLSVSDDDVLRGTTIPVQIH